MLKITRVIVLAVVVSAIFFPANAEAAPLKLGLTLDYDGPTAEEVNAGYSLAYEVFTSDTNRWLDGVGQPERPEPLAAGEFLLTSGDGSYYAEMELDVENPESLYLWAGGSFFLTGDPHFPSITGLMNGDIHACMDKGELPPEIIDTNGSPWIPIGDLNETGTLEILFGRLYNDGKFLGTWTIETLSDDPTDPPTVPEPSSLVLLGLGVVSLAGVLRKKLF